MVDVSRWLEREEVPPLWQSLSIAGKWFVNSRREGCSPRFFVGIATVLRSHWSQSKVLKVSCCTATRKAARVKWWLKTLARLQGLAFPPFLKLLLFWIRVDRHSRKISFFESRLFTLLGGRAIQENISKVLILSRVGSAISSEELLKILEGWNRLNTVLLQLLLPFGLGLSTSGGTPLWCLVGRVSTSLTDATIGGLLKQTEQLNQQAFRMYTRNDLLF